MITTNPFCEKICNQLNEFHENTMSNFLSKIISKHLTRCKTCQSEYQLLQDTIHSLQKMDVPIVSPVVLNRVIQNLKDPGGGEPSAKKPLDLGLNAGVRPA